MGKSSSQILAEALVGIAQSMRGSDAIIWVCSRDSFAEYMQYRPNEPEGGQTAKPVKVHKDEKCTRGCFRKRCPVVGLSMTPFEIRDA